VEPGDALCGLVARTHPEQASVRGDEQRTVGRIAAEAVYVDDTGITGRDRR
jgi:hypothetical protein